MTALQAITLCIAVLGAALGILNTWKAYDRDRLKLKVRPKFYIHTRAGVLTGADIPLEASSFNTLNPGIEEKLQDLCIEVTNLSAFPVTINEVGLTLKGTKDRAWLSEYFISEDRKLPLRLDPRSSVTVFGTRHGSSEGIPGHAVAAYATTDCGETVEGSSRALRLLTAESFRREGKSRPTDPSK